MTPLRASCLNDGLPSLIGSAPTPFRAALIWILVASVAACSGCLVRRRKIDGALNPNVPLLTAGLDQLADSLRERYQAIETLNATVDLEPAVLATSKGEIAEYKDVRGYILVRKPGWIRVIALYPVVRATAFDMVSDGQTFRLFLPSKNLFLTGLNRIDKPSPRKLENLRPDHLLEALVIRPPDPPNERAVLENWTDKGTASYVLHIIRQEGPGRLQLARNVWFDRRSLEIARQRIFDEQGDVVTDAQYADWDRHGAVKFPKHIVIRRPKDEYELRVRFQKLVLNEPIGQEKFNLPQPPGVKVERVGETPGKPSAQDSTGARKPRGGGRGSGG